MFYGVVGLVILVLDIIAILQVIQGGGDAAKKLLWVLIILLLPLVGMLLWFLIGNSKTIA